MTATGTRSQTAKDRLLALMKSLGQEHLLAFWDRLTSEEREQLGKQIEAIDPAVLRELREQRRKASASGVDEGSRWAELSAKAQPPRAMRLDGGGVSFSKEDARRRGAELLRGGKVAMILVAGGLGTRLGFDQPKGMYPIGPLSGRSLFQVFFEQLKSASRHYGERIPLYLMTSPATDETTRQFLRENSNFGLPADDVRIFCQSTMWALDDRGEQILMESPSSLFLGPDGHGGMLAALAKSGGLKQAQSAGIEHFFYGQIDNPLTQICDERLLGSHICAGSEMTTQVIRKRHPLERVGNVVSIDGRTHVIEYSDLPDEFARQTNPDGSLKLWAGNLAIHVMAVEFLARCAKRSDALPFHAAHKKVPHIDASGRKVEPALPNAYRFERFIFDLLPLARQALVVEADPAEAFAPVKNSNFDRFDTPRTAKAAMIALHTRWLNEAGATVASGVPVEINPLWAGSPDEVRGRVQAGTVIDQPTYFSPTGAQTVEVPPEDPIPSELPAREPVVREPPPREPPPREPIVREPPREPLVAPPPREPPRRESPPHESRELPAREINATFVIPRDHELALDAWVEPTIAKAESPKVESPKVESPQPIPPPIAPQPAFVASAPRPVASGPGLLHAVIMAGGSGTRFWPASRNDRPKQLLDLAGGRTMIQATMDRLGLLVPVERTWVMTSRNLVGPIAEQLPEVDLGNIVGEPCKRDTAPAIGLSALLIARDDPEATLVVLPSDHLIQPVSAFQAAIRQAVAIVQERPEALVTFGIKPTYAAETFGYIERAQPTGRPMGGGGRQLDYTSPAFDVLRFREKPARSVAEQYVAAGTYYWNSGIFVWKAKTILAALDAYEPQMLAHLKTIADAVGQPDYTSVLDREFSAIHAKSIDFAVMEYYYPVVVIQAPFTWDDVGSWQAMARAKGADADGNTAIGKHLGIRTARSIIRTSSDHLVVTLGLSNTIVVHTPDATLVADKSQEEAIREVVKALADKGWSEYL
ncbi:MAG: UTP--glucose-1-phosphate uridylyltransferase [Planctomycetaceae bacterium]|nr:UTP--glucose-1-phosphate uridylyltransferase [Planctomycetaceae bacterium]